MKYLTWVRIGMFLVAALMTGAAAAQLDARSYPTKPIRVIVGMAAGGGADMLARIVGQKLSEALGQPVIVENRVGAASMIAAELVAKARPDGYTLLYCPSSVMTVNPILYKNVAYSPTRDFVPISTSTTYSLFMIVNAGEQIHTVKGLVEYLKANPQKANYGGASGLFQLALELFKLRTNTQVEFVPYKGAVDAAQAVLTGNVLMAIVDAGSASVVLKSGRVRFLAATSPTRVPSYPEVPTMAEAGYPELEILGWQAFLAPAGTPVSIVRILQEEINRILKLPDVTARLLALSISPTGSTSEELARKISLDLERWSAVAKSSNIRLSE